MALLYLDFETYSAADLRRVGSAAYAEHPSTGVWCAAMVLDAGGTSHEAVWSPGESLPDWALQHLTEGGLVVAHNAAFESSMLRFCEQLADWPAIDAGQWVDTMLLAALANLPRGLEGLAKTLGSPVTKDMEGAAVMRRYTRATEEGPPDIPAADLERMKQYCLTDVYTTREVLKRLPLPPVEERRAMVVDRRINERGVPVDLELARHVSRMADARADEIAASVWDQTQDLIGATNTPALMRWLTSRGIEIPTVVRKRVVNGTTTFESTPSIDRASIAKLLKQPNLPPDVRSALNLRVEAGRVASLAKVDKLAESVNADGRLRNCFNFAGASTGRWSSWGVQVHNLTRPPKSFKDIREAFVRAVRERDVKAASALVPVLDGLSYLLRSLFIASPGSQLFGFDFAGIEARGAAWLAGDEEKLDVFRRYDAATGESRAAADPYVVAAAAIARAIGAQAVDRQIGKIAELALQYGMGAKKFADFAAQAGLALPLKDARAIRLAWREKNRTIVNLHAALGAAFDVLIDAEPGESVEVSHLRFTRHKSRIEMQLPSGRALYYWRPHRKTVTRRVEDIDEDGNLVERDVEMTEMRFYGGAGKGMEIDSTYGGKLLENAVQALCRDLLRDSMNRLEEAGWQVVLHVHDSCTCEAKFDANPETFSRLASQCPDWAFGFPIAVDAYKAAYFKG